MPLTPASTGVWRTTGSTSAAISLDDLVGVAEGEQAGGGAAAGHAVAAGVVDDDEVDAAGLLALGREAGAGAAADDRLAVARPCARNFVRMSARGMAGMGGLLGDLAVGGDEGVGEVRVVDVERQADDPAVGRSASRPASSASKSAASAAGSWKAPPAMSRAETPRSGIRKRTGPGQALSLAAIQAPICAALLGRGAHQRDVGVVAVEVPAGDSGRGRSRAPRS